MFAFTIYDLLAENLAERSAHPAVVAGDVHLSYEEMNAQVEAVAAWLGAAGVRRGDRVVIHLPKCIDEIVATFAVARVGGVFVNVNYQWTSRQLRYVVKDAGVRVLITDARRGRDMVEAGLIDELDQVLVRGPALDHPKVRAWSKLDSFQTPPVRDVIDQDLAALIYTSGSTGMPKGVMLTHRNLIDGARSVARYLHNSGQDRALGLLPMSFDYGLSQVTTMFLVGGAVVLSSVAMPAEIVKTLNAHAVTGMAAVPPTWIQVVRYLQETGERCPSLRYITNSGGKIPPVILSALPDVFPGVDIYLMYGLTEAFRSTYLPPDQFRTKMGAIGRAIPNCEVFVVDPEKGLCGPNEPGELIHRGSLISRGYWRNPEATREKIRPCPHLRHLIGDEPVLHSGDIVHADADGVLWFEGRADAMIKCSGFRISPTEVEDIVFQSGRVTDAVAFGVEDEELGQAVHVVVSGVSGETVDAASLEEYCRQNMPHYMIPRRLHHWTGPMPRTSSGKIDRVRVIDFCAEGRSANEPAAQRGQTCPTVVAP